MDLLTKDKTNPSCLMYPSVPNFYSCGRRIGERSECLSDDNRNRLVKASKTPTENIALRIRRAVEQKQLIDNHRYFLEFSKASEKITGVPLPLNYQVKSIDSVSDSEYLKPRCSDADLLSADFDTGEINPKSRGKEAEGASAYTVVSAREWSGEYRVRTQIDKPHGKPPEQSGERITDKLSMRGARKLSDSCEYLAKKGGGYKTFLTLTFDMYARSRVEVRVSEGEFCYLSDKGGAVSSRIDFHQGGKEKGKNIDWSSVDYTKVDFVDGNYSAEVVGAGVDVTYSTIQKEASRFFDAINKMRQRGWNYKKIVGIKGFLGDKKINVIREKVVVKQSKVVGIKGFLGDKKINVIREKVNYCWVVENPLNEKGQQNPHLHVLMDWGVGYKNFRPWAARLEKLWGMGMANLERIKSGEKAGAYMAKAAGYMTKSSDGGQGVVKGNRYGISRSARAPEWECVERLEFGVMGHLIADVYDYFKAKYSGVFGKRSRLKAALDGAKGVERKKIGSALERVRESIAKIPAVASKYQIVIKSKQDFELFMSWAKCPSEVGEVLWLPPKAEGAGYDQVKHRGGVHYREFLKRMGFNRASRRWWDIPLSVYEDSQGFVSESVNTIFDWINYEREGCFNE